MKKEIKNIILETLIALIVMINFCVSTSAMSLPPYNENKTPQGLANYAVNAYNVGYGYAKGYYGQIITQDNLNMYSDLYPEYYTDEMKSALQAYIGQEARFADCIGLVKGYFWYNSTDIYPNFSIFPDTSAEDLFRTASKKGDISTLPEIPGIILYDRNTPHIGIYVGNGMVVDDRTFTQGTMYTSVSQYTWTNWIMLDQMDYSAYDTSTENTGKLFERQINTINDLTAFLPSDIQATLVVVLIFIFALGIARIIL